LQRLAFSDYVSTNGLRWIVIPSSVVNIDTSTPYGAIDNYVPLTCVVTPVGSVARTLSGLFTTGTNNSKSGAANPSFVTDVNSCPAPTISSLSVSTGSAAGGTSVTVYGTNLWTVMGVTLGGAAASITSLPADGSITFTTPSGTIGAQDLVLTTPGPSVTSAHAFTYTTPPPPNFTLNSPSTGSTLGGTSVTLVGTNLTAATSVTFGGAAATIVSNSSTAIIVTTPPGSAGAANIVITTAGGSATRVNAFTYAVPASVAQISISVAARTYFRTVAAIVATSDSPGKITFYAYGKSIPGCKAIVATTSGSNYMATCSWKPNIHGVTQLSASITPSNANFYGYSSLVATGTTIRTSPR
jgi:hypothetical protein